jgi:cytochrome bd-type quinol oxidase subunit 1
MPASGVIIAFTTFSAIVAAWQGTRCGMKRQAWVIYDLQTEIDEISAAGLTITTAGTVRFRI